MTGDVRIIRTPDFLKATPEGLLDLARSREVLLTVATAASGLDNFEIILDTRQAESALSYTDLWYLAVELGQYRHAFQRRTAVICPTDRFDYAGFFALCSQNRGFNIRAFTSFEEAIEWLIAPGA